MLRSKVLRGEPLAPRKVASGTNCVGFLGCCAQPAKKFSTCLEAKLLAPTELVFWVTFNATFINNFLILIVYGRK